GRGRDTRRAARGAGALLAAVSRLGRAGVGGVVLRGVPVVTGLAFTPVKATRLHTVESLALGPDGVRENRRFYVIDERDRMINSKRLGALQTVVADYSDADRTLRLTLPDGRIGEGSIRLGEPIATRFFSQPGHGRQLDAA